MLHEQNIEPVADVIRDRVVPRLSGRRRPGQPKELLRVLSAGVPRRVDCRAAGLAALVTAFGDAALHGIDKSSSISRSPDRQERRRPGALAPDGGIALVESQLLVITSDTVLRRAISAKTWPAIPNLAERATGFLRSSPAALAAISLDYDAAGGSGPSSGIASDQAAHRGEAVGEGLRHRHLRDHGSEGQVGADRRRDRQLVPDDQAEARAAGRRALGSRLEELRSRVRDAENRVRNTRSRTTSSVRAASS